MLDDQLMEIVVRLRNAISNENVSDHTLRAISTNERLENHVDSPNAGDHVAVSTANSLSTDQGAVVPGDQTPDIPNDIPQDHQQPKEYLDDSEPLRDRVTRPDNHVLDDHRLSEELLPSESLVSHNQPYNFDLAGVDEDPESPLSTGQSTSNLFLLDPRSRASSISSKDDSDPETSLNTGIPLKLIHAEEQLNSIPDYNDIAIATLPLAKPENSYFNRTNLNDFLHIIPIAVLKYLNVREVIIARGISSSIKEVVDDYFLHQLLSNSEIKLVTQYIDDFEGRKEREWEVLLPVIRRVERNKRFLPQNRLVYEPDPQRFTRYYYRHGKFEILRIEFRLKEGNTYYWPLNPHFDSTVDSDYRPTYRNRQSIHLLQIVKHTKLHQYYRFDTFKNSPVHVFYKDDPDPDLNVFRLHALSIPLDYLRAALYEGYGLVSKPRSRYSNSDRPLLDLN